MYDSAYEKIIKKSLRSRVETYKSKMPYYWGASFFNLDKVAAFNELNEEKKTNILRNCSQDIIVEGIHIENRGIDMASFMIQKTTLTNEKHIYSLINADEIEHYYILKRFLFSAPSPEDENPFISLMKECINSADSYRIVFFLQVILEGWGMTYYNGLMKACLEPNLQKSLSRILLDESSHHSVGLIHYKNHQGQTRAQLNKMMDILAALLGMLRAGPQRIIGCIERETEGLTLSGKRKIFEEIKAQQAAQRQLDAVKTLLRHDLSNELVDRLDKLNLFTAMTSKEYTMNLQKHSTTPQEYTMNSREHAMEL